ncbi:MAG: ankyrin repeat domain-containing protein [Holosporales bacterium]|jgi:ankyrin repeat protein|nr:ankyrin repeat domain-containing protein [Holosporales bacterium]
MKRFYKTMALVSLLGISNLSCGELGDARADTKAIDIQLWEAVYQNKPKEVKGLLRAGVDIEAQNEYGLTPLHYAAFRGHTEIVEILLAAGANKEAKNIIGKTPLHIAVYSGNVLGSTESVKVFLAAGASRKARAYDGKTPLDRAPSEELKRLLA